MEGGGWRTAARCGAVRCGAGQRRAGQRRTGQGRAGEVRAFSGADRLVVDGLEHVADHQLAALRGQPLLLVRVSVRVRVS